MVLIRKAESKDVKALLGIYNYEVIHGTATLDIHPKSLQEWNRWFEVHNVDNHPLLVAEIENEVVGYAALSPYREKEAFQSTVELSVYIHQNYRKQGIASALMGRILENARKDSTTHIVVSVITSGNKASVRLHEKYGFHFCGIIHEVGLKFGTYQDIENYELKVSESAV